MSTYGEKNTLLEYVGDVGQEVYLIVLTNQKVLLA